MPSRYEEEDLSKLRPIPISSRSSKISVDHFVDPDAIASKLAPIVEGDLSALFPDVLAGASLKHLSQAIRHAKDERSEIIWLVGAHVLKCGLSLYLNSLIDEGFITSLATTGSLAIHDIELSFFGETSEDVARELPQGRFGMSEETAMYFTRACKEAARERMGMGEGLGRHIEASEAPHKRYSIFASAYRRSVPATVHMAFGTDIVHQHADFPAALAGDLTMKDFRILTRRVGRLFEGGVVIVFGSAVVLPEVFLKSVSVNYNLGRKPQGITAASFDMLQPYRVRENVLRRPFEGCGESYSFIGHHEIMLPLLYCMLMRG